MTYRDHFLSRSYHATECSLLWRNRCRIYDDSTWDEKSQTIAQITRNLIRWGILTSCLLSIPPYKSNLQGRVLLQPCDDPEIHKALVQGFWQTLVNKCKKKKHINTFEYKIGVNRMSQHHQNAKMWAVYSIPSTFLDAGHSILSATQLPACQPQGFSSSGNTWTNTHAKSEISVWWQVQECESGIKDKGFNCHGMRSSSKGSRQHGI